MFGCSPTRSTWSAATTTSEIGGSIRANQLNTVAVGFPNGFWVVSGLWTGDPAADLLTGLTSLAIHDQEFDGGNTGRRWKLYRPFIQDDWRDQQES